MANERNTDKTTQEAIAKIVEQRESLISTGWFKKETTLSSVHTYTHPVSEDYYDTLQIIEKAKVGPRRDTREK